MVVTPYGDMDLDDDVAMTLFLYAHSRRHTIYNQLAGLAGGGPLRGEIDGMWMHRHVARHISIATHTGLNLSSADTKVLALPGRWRTQQELADWSELHNRLHLRIDQQLNL